MMTLHNQLKPRIQDLNVFKKENAILKEELKAVVTDQNTLFNEVNKNKIIIRGIKQTSVQSADDIKQFLSNVANKIGSSVSVDDIASVKILNNRRTPQTNVMTDLRNQQKTAIVEFKLFAKKLDFVKQRKNLKTVDGCDHLSISDLLPKSMQKLYSHSLILKSVGYATVYHQNGIIYAKKTHQGNPIIIRSLDQVDSITKKLAVGNQHHTDDFEEEN